jgi:ornithine cyclodeaminase/alanine dehydrogenase-like protein (mu-crystallin family)
MSLLLLNEDELRQIITISETIEVVEDAFAALAEDRINVPGDFTLNLPEVKGEVQVKGTYLDQAPYFVIKVGSKFHDNPTINLPTQSGFIAIFDAATGFPVAIMVDNGYLTNMRAGAAGALTAKHLANEKLNRVAVIGSGNQAYVQIKSLKTVKNNINLVSIWGRTPVNVDNYARRIVEDHDLNVEIAASVEAAVREADVVITATASQEPLIRADWLKPGVHIIATGSNRPVKQELHLDVLQRADVIIVDQFDQCAAAGEIHHGLEAGVISRENIQGELGDLIIGKISGRTHPDQITLADLTGLDTQDATVAILALEKALFLGLGQRVASSAIGLPS